MQLKTALAGVLRALRLHRRLRYESLSDASGRSKISALERGETSITLEKFESLAEALQIDPVALMALCMSARHDIPYSSLIDSARRNLHQLEAEGGLELLAEQFVSNDLVQRGRGKPTDPDKLEAVRDKRAQGMSQAEIARALGFSPTVVNRLWKRLQEEEKEGED
ncbi:transcriptional regulator [Pseudomonas abietaniphila]|uniref:transcriptional regulator n=1 Tax=Pseudomonas abietaniphila TaxID=89065 RepID=UPI000781211F|nr:transcriptional regulator [Pseudomonas abietaniphila]